jgi:S-disulfanyl-L-cysteine oxidoreductase SoxD
MYSARSLEAAAAALCALLLIGGEAFAQAYGGPYNLGRPATPAEVTEYDIDIMPDGTGLPPGQGTHAEGAAIYQSTCAMCHGDNLRGGDPTKVTYSPLLPRGEALIGGRGSLNTNAPVKTVESYWPYATTLYDYIRRAMPYVAPGTLKDNEVYALVAYILGEANVVPKTTVMTKDTLPKVQMPNRDGFIPDPRPVPAIKFD